MIENLVALAAGCAGLAFVRLARNWFYEENSRKGFAACMSMAVLFLTLSYYSQNP